MRGLFIITVFIISMVASAQEESPFGNCFGSAEGHYMQMSERLISLLQMAAIDSSDFERYRAELINKRESDLYHCAQVQKTSLGRQVRFEEQPTQGAAIVQERGPASLNPVYEELESHTDY